MEGIEIKNKTDKRVVEIIIEKGVSNSSYLRDELNIIYIMNQRDYLPEPKPIIYMGICTTGHIKIFGKVPPKSDILISYYYCSDPIYKAIKDYKK